MIPNTAGELSPPLLLIFYLTRRFFDVLPYRYTDLIQVHVNGRRNLSGDNTSFLSGRLKLVGYLCRAAT